MNLPIVNPLELNNKAMSREILFWIAEIGWAVTIMIFIRHIHKMQKLQRQYFGMVNDYLVYYNNLRDEFLKFIDFYNSRHIDKIIYRDGKFTLIKGEDVEPININDL